MLEVYDLQQQLTAILQNSYDRIETETINAVGSFQFSIPADDPKNQYCRHFHYVRLNNDGNLYRILEPRKSKEDISVKIYDCEHVIATLTDDVLFGQHVVGNLGVYTADVINYVLNRQENKRWELKECDFNRQFEYAWENENLLAALFSIPNRFTEPYYWKFETPKGSSKWYVSLKRIDENAEPQFYIRAGRNLLSMEEEQAGADICTRLYCLGYGEGVNQLTISDVNNGVPYLLAPQSIINQYGLITRIFVDRRFEDAQSLKERGQAILAELQEPRVSKSFNIVDLYKLTEQELDKAEIAKVAKLTDDGSKAYITGITRNHDVPGDIAITLASKAVDIAQSIADLADRQRIEQVYSQGATQIYAQSVQANATETVKAKLNFYIPAEMRIVNAVKVKINLSAFRSYSKTTSGGGATTATSSSGGSSTSTSSSGGGGAATSSSGGGSATTSGSSGGATVTSSSGGGSYTSTAYGGSFSGYTNSVGVPHESAYTTEAKDHKHIYVRPKATSTTVYGSHSHLVNIGSHSHSLTIPNHTHTISISNHTHSVSIPAHTHSVSIPAHTHSVSIPAHTHSVTIANHTHGIEQGIFTFGNPNSAKLYVDGAFKANVTTDSEMDITAYLLNSSGKINRGAWHSIEVLPNDKAYVTIDMMIQGFIQSRGGNTV